MTHVVSARELNRLRYDHAALRFEWAMLQDALRETKFDGQARIHSPEPGPGRFTFGRQNLPRAQPVFLPALAIPPVVALAAPIVPAIALYLGLVNSAGRGKKPVITFNAKGYRGDEKGELDLESVANLSADEVDEACPRFGEVQKRTDLATTTIRTTRPGLNPQDFGTAVHSHLDRQIKALNDPNFRSEISFLKDEDAGNEVRYGRVDTVRVDVLERVGDGTVCVYDVKTGRRGLTIDRMHEISKSVFRAYPDTTRIVVTEVRPSQ